MSEPKYKVGDKVRIKSIDWYNENKNRYGNINCGYMPFTSEMSIYCGAVLTICDINDEFSFYHMKKCEYQFTDEMIEGLMEEETKPEQKFKVGDRIYSKYHKPSNDLEIIEVIRGDGHYGYRIKNHQTNGTYFIWEYEISDYKLVEEETKLLTYEETVEIIETMQGIGDSWECPQGYQFVDENGNVINAQKIELEKVNTLKTQSDNMETETHRGHCTTDPETTSEGKKRGVVYFWDNDFADKVELDLSDRELIQEDGKWFVVKKKKEYPKTYEECCRIVNANPCIKLVYNLSDGQKYYHDEDNLYLYENFRRLKICRDAYWKLYGEEMGLDKPWEPTMETVYCISRNNNVMKCSYRGGKSNILEFPTPEMRDTFYENFKEEIEKCKELL